MNTLDSKIVYRNFPDRNNTKEMFSNKLKCRMGIRNSGCGYTLSRYVKFILVNETECSLSLI